MAMERMAWVFLFFQTDLLKKTDGPGIMMLDHLRIFGWQAITQKMMTTWSLASAR